MALLALALASAPASAEIAVIANRDSPVQSLTTKQVSDLYLGRSRTLALGETLTVFEQPVDSPLREMFFLSLNGMKIKQVNAYWARLRFSGEIMPPQSLSDSKAVIEAVKRERNAVGYIDAAMANSSVRVVLTLKEP
ncbi:MAG TPA: hypothetical protein VJ001_06015 [Rhodocyclaceae bacterium]|nr:hypothetical protein [Rhodocyclaceae bacterium]